MSDAEEKNNERPGEEGDFPTASFNGSAPGEQIGHSASSGSWDVVQ